MVTVIYGAREFQQKSHASHCRAVPQAVPQREPVFHCRRQDADRPEWHPGCARLFPVLSAPARRAFVHRPDPSSAAVPVHAAPADYLCGKSVRSPAPPEQANILSPHAACRADRPGLNPPAQFHQRHQIPGPAPFRAHEHRSRHRRYHSGFPGAAH